MVQVAPVYSAAGTLYTVQLPGPWFPQPSGGHLLVAARGGG